MSEAAPEPTPAVTPETPTPTPTPPAPAQDPTDWKAEARKWEERAKGNKSALDELTGKFQSLESQHGEVSTKLQTYEAEKERAAVVSDVAKTAGVPASALRGTTREELEAHAAELAELIKPSGPVIPGQERTPHTVQDSDDRVFARKLFGKD